MSHKLRVIALVDMDCFYCQVEEKLNPSLRGKPVAVVQYNLWRDGGIIAANYQAKEKGVTKGMWMHEAKNLCPEIEFARVAELRGRADLTKYREAGNQVALVLSSFVNVLERASVDEAYLDLTESVKTELAKGISNIPLEKLSTTHVVGSTTSDFITNISSNQDTDGFCEDDLRLAIGGIIVERIRNAVLEKTGYKCSAGIAHNKILAKLVCGLHKPNKQTILPQNAIIEYFAELPLKKIKRLGGKFGKKVAEELKIEYVGGLLKYSEKELMNKFDAKTGHWLFNIARGIDHEPVSPKLICKSISCCKRFPGKNALFKHKDVEHWTNELCLEISERLQKDQEENNRRAKMITISFTQEINKSDASSSKTIPLKTYDAKKIAHEAFEIIKNSCVKLDNSYHVKYLGISAGNFDTIMNKTKNIKYYLGKDTQHSSGKKLISKSSVDKIDEEKGKNQINTQSSSEQELFSQNITHDKDEQKSTGTKNKFQFVRSHQINFLDDSNTSLQNYHKSKSQKNIIDATILSVSITNNMEKVSCSAEDQNDISDGKFKEAKEASIPKVSVGLAIDENTVPVNSFFARYFDNVDENTSDITATTSKDDDDLESATTSKEDDDLESIIASSSEQMVKCEECNQIISTTEIVSHRDYHFALNLHKEELLSNNSSFSSNNISEEEVNDKCSKKRKIIKPFSAIDVFLEKQELDSTIFTETCNECNKKIKLTEWEYHSDYHAAKDLYKKINCKNNSSNFNTKKSIKSVSSDISRYLKRKSS